MEIYYNEIKLLGGANVVMKTDEAMAYCRSCGAKIKFAKTLKGKLMPIEPVMLNGKQEWRSHFSSCPQAGKFRKKSY